MSHQKTFSSSESYWTLSVSGLIQSSNKSTSLSQLAPCFYHEWINLRFLELMRMLAFLQNQGGTRSAVFGPDDSWSSALSAIQSLMPQFILGRNTMLANFFSRLIPILGSEWTLKLSVFQQLRRRWPVSIDLFATSLPHSFLPYFLRSTIPMLLGRRVFSNHGMGGRRMLFLPMR